MAPRQAPLTLSEFRALWRTGVKLLTPAAFAKAVLGAMRCRIGSVRFQAYACSLLSGPFKAARFRAAVRLAFVLERCWKYIFDAVEVVPCKAVCPCAVVTLKCIVTGPSGFDYMGTIAVDGGIDAVRTALGPLEDVRDEKHRRVTEYPKVKADWRECGEWMLLQFTPLDAEFYDSDGSTGSSQSNYDYPGRYLQFGVGVGSDSDSDDGSDYGWFGLA